MLLHYPRACSCIRSLGDLLVLWGFWSCACLMTCSLVVVIVAIVVFDDDVVFMVVMIVLVGGVCCSLLSWCYGCPWYRCSCSCSCSCVVGVFVSRVCVVA